MTPAQPSLACKRHFVVHLVQRPGHEHTTSAFAADRGIAGRRPRSRIHIRPARSVASSLIIKRIRGFVAALARFAMPFAFE